jgi:hypothetical protein
MTVSSTVIWRPEPLTARLIAAARGAAQDFGSAAAAQSRSKRVAGSMRVLGAGTDFVVGPADPLGGILEAGAHPHRITPRRQALKLADGSFVSGPVDHPGMPGRHFMRDTLPLWGVFYRRRAGGAFRGI